MYVKYDSLNRLEPLTMILCNPSSRIKTNTDSSVSPTKTLGILSDVSDEEIVFNFNEISQLNFRVNKVIRNDAEENEQAEKLYNLIQPRRLIYVSNIGYFVITNINEEIGDSDNGFSKGLTYKDITSQSIESEIQNKKVPYIEDNTYKFIGEDSDNAPSLLPLLVQTLPLWTIGNVDDLVAARYRTFEDVDVEQDILSFMISDMQEAYECIFQFDIINRVINVYDQANYIRQTDIHLTRADIINELKVTQDADELYTAISVLGDDNVSIAAVNPLGTNVIYDFSHYADWMSDGLGAKVLEWQGKVKANLEYYCGLSKTYYEKLETLNNHKLELERVITQITMYQRCRDNIVAESGTDLVDSYNDAIAAAGGETISIKNEISETLAEVDRLIEVANVYKRAAEINIATAEEDLNNAYASVENERLRYAIDKYFTEGEYEELCTYMFEGSYNDEYVVITEGMTWTERFEQMKTLYNRAASSLEKASRPSCEFNVSAESFIFDKAFKAWSDQLETGCIVNVELAQNDIAKLFLSNITVNYADHSMNLTFGNRITKFDMKSLFDTVLGSVSKSSNSIGYIKDIIAPVKNGELEEIRSDMGTIRDISMQQALSSTGEDVVIDASGITSKRKLPDGTYDPRQIKIVGKNIVLTDDAWKSCKVAIGELNLGEGVENATYGVNSEILMGDIIIGNQLRVVDSDGNDMFTAVDGKIESKVSKTDYNGETITGLINLDANTAKIQANHIDLTGSVTISALADDAKSTIDKGETALELLTTADTRNDNQNPLWYVKNYPRQVVREFKLCSTMGLPVSNLYCQVETSVPWFDTTGGYPTQVATITTSYIQYKRRGISDTAWGAWESVDATIANWCHDNDKTYIDGGKIYAKSITTSQLATDAIKSLNYSETDKTGSKLDLQNGLWEIYAGNLSGIVIYNSKGERIAGLTAMEYIKEDDNEVVSVPNFSGGAITGNLDNTIYANLLNSGNGSVSISPITGALNYEHHYKNENLFDPSIGQSPLSMLDGVEVDEYIGSSYLTNGTKIWRVQARSTHEHFDNSTTEINRGFGGSISNIDMNALWVKGDRTENGFASITADANSRNVINNNYPKYSCVNLTAYRTGSDYTTTYGGLEINSGGFIRSRRNSQYRTTPLTYEDCFYGDMVAGSHLLTDGYSTADFSGTIEITCSYGAGKYFYQEGVLKTLYEYCVYGTNMLSMYIRPYIKSLDGKYYLGKYTTATLNNTFIKITSGTMILNPNWTTADSGGTQINPT